MLLNLIVAVQIAIAPQQQADSAYSTAALREEVQKVVAANRVAPPALGGYRGHLESEVALIIVDTLGRERTGQIEQLGGTATWDRSKGYEAHVEGLRSQTLGFPISFATRMRAWTLPMLYGQRLLFPLVIERRVGLRSQARSDTLTVVHPFADDRESFYRFSGGDTVAILTTQERRIPIVRIRAIPNLALDSEFGAFDGEIDVDGDRHQIIRMRGRFVVSAKRENDYPAATKLLIKATGVVAAAYVEYENGEIEGKYWLPVIQRVEMQAQIGLLNGARSVVRIVSRFSDYSISDSSGAATAPWAYTRRTTTYATLDSLGAFTDWRNDLGKISGSVSADDFIDMAPPSMRPTGPPTFTLFPRRVDRALHYNRVEGFYTGAEASVGLRDLSPGTSLRADAGWAWAEQTLRGGGSVSRSYSTSSIAVTGERRLASTEDFLRDLEQGSSSIGALLSVDESDYVDRRSLSLTHVRILGSLRHAIFTGRMALAEDRDVAASLQHGLLAPNVEFRPNRHAASGRYALLSGTYELHPNVTGEFLDAGAGATLHIENAVGALNWTRIEAALSGRRYQGPFTMTTRIDAGVVISNAPPPQTLFELGGSTGRLVGYGYKEFAGDRAAVFAGSMSYGLPLLKAPIRIRHRLFPGIAPGLRLGTDGGWTGVSSQATHQAILALGDGTEANVLSVPTGHVRATGSVGITLFSNFLFIGRARPIDYPGPWRWRFLIGAG